MLRFGDAADRRGRTTFRAPKVIEIRVPEVDTTGFAARFRHMATLPITNRAPAVISDTDQDGLVEISAGAGWVDQIWERVEAASDSFHMVHEITERYHASQLTSDVNGNGRPELDYRVAPDSSRSAYLRFFEGRMPGELATSFLFDHRMWEEGNVLEFPREVDLDGDGIREILYRGYAETGRLQTFVAEYADTLKNLRQVWSIHYPGPDGGLSAGDWAVGDFDLDGKQEFATGDIDGLVYLVEHTGTDNDYALTWQDTVPTYNAYFHSEGDDLDGDGRPECFLGGASSMSGVWTNVITCFETVGDDEYEATVELRITGAGGLNTENLLQGDVDGDGEKELVLSAGGGGGV